MDIMILIQIIHLMKMTMDFELEKDNMLSQLRNYYDEDELEVNEDSTYEEIKEVFDEMMEECADGEYCLFPNERDYDSEDEDACNIYLHLFFQDFLFNQAVQNTDYLIKSL